MLCSEHTISICGGNRVPHTTEQFSSTAEYLKVQLNSTRFWHYLPGDNIRFQRLWSQSHRTALQPTSDAICKPRLLLVLLTDWLTDYKLQFSTTSSLGSINLLEQLAELLETFYQLDHWLIIKGYNAGTARWKCYTEQRVGKGCKASMSSPGVPLSQHLYMFTNW